MSKILIINLFILIFLFTGCSSIPMTTQDRTFNKYKDYDYCKIEAIKQSQKNSCGSASLASVLNYWGIDITEEDILKEYPLNEDEGYSILKLREISIDKGLTAHGYSMYESFDKQLEEQLLKGRPVICAVSFPNNLYFAKDIPIYSSFYSELTWRFGTRRSHYLVIFGLNDNKFLVMDSSHGLVSIEKSRFYNCWKKKDFGVLLCGKLDNFPDS